MRIISGQWKGVVIHPPKGLPVRPTTDRAKESLFNILAQRLDWEATQVLDLFAGTGNIAYECCSRGAKSVLAVDKHVGCTDFIKRMKAQYGMAQLAVRKQDVYAFLGSCTDRYGFIFADAPYAQQELVKVPRLVMERGLLTDDGVLVMEHEAHLDLSAQSGFFEQRIYGQSAFSFFRLGSSTATV